MKNIHPFYHIAGMVIFAAISLYIMLMPSKAATVDFLLVGTKFSDLQSSLHQSYTTTESAGGRITYSFMVTDDDLTNIAVKDDIIEVVEVYSNFTKPDNAMELYMSISNYLIGQEKCRLIRSYNTTLEFQKNNVIVRLEQIPTSLGWLVKYTAYLE